MIALKSHRMMLIFLLGAVKITPAHDHNDYEVGVRHNLPFMTILDDAGNITGDCPQFVVRTPFHTLTNSPSLKYILL